MGEYKIIKIYKKSSLSHTLFVDNIMLNKLLYKDLSSWRYCYLHQTHYCTSNNLPNLISDFESNQLISKLSKILCSIKKKMFLKFGLNLLCYELMKLNSKFMLLTPYFWLLTIRFYISSTNFWSLLLTIDGTSL